MPIWNQILHNLLSARHGDTTAGTVTRGATIVGQSASPTWQILSLGASGTILRSNGVDLLFSTATFPNTVTSGDVLIATGANTIGSLAVGAANTIVRSTGTAPAYSTATYPNTVTAGSVLFATATNAIGEDNVNIFWDNVNKRLGLGMATPTTRLVVDKNNADVVGGLRIGQTGTGDASMFFFLSSASQVWAMGIDNSDAAKFKISTDIANADVGVNTRLTIDTSGNVGIGTPTPGAQLNVTSALEVFQTATLTAGSVGSIVCPYDTVAGETDAKGGNLNGCLVVNNASLKIFARTGGLWKGAAIAGFSIPNYKTQKQEEIDETICPLCKEQMKPGQALGLLADKWYNNKDSKEGLHALAAHLRCLMEKENLVTAS